MRPDPAAAASGLLAMADGLYPFPYRVISDEMTRICETVPTPLRAAADQPRAPEYMVWMCTIDN